jgi:hypothetical protein
MEGKIFDLKSGAPIDFEPLPRISERHQRRIQQVVEMWQSGMKTKGISQFLHLSQRAVQKDLADAKRLARLSVENFDSTAELGHEIAFLQKLRRLAMREFSLGTFESTKIGALRLAVEISARLTALLQSVGLLTRVPERVEIIENPFEDGELRQRYYDVLLEVRRRGETPLGM